MAVPPLKVQSTTPQFYAEIQDQRTIPTQRQAPYALELPVIKDKPIRRWGNCIRVVEAAGYDVPRTRDGYARTVPVTSLKLPPEGELVIIRTAESWMGHVLLARWDGERLVSVIDSEGSGREIPLSVYRGYI